jgi:hypothetical protein
MVNAIKCIQNNWIKHDMPIGKKSLYKTWQVLKCHQSTHKCVLLTDIWMKKLSSGLAICHALSISKGTLLNIVIR